MTSADLKRNGFVWSNFVGLTGGWRREEPDGTWTDLAAAGRKYVAVVINPETTHIYRQWEAKTRAEALRGLYTPEAVKLADSIYRD